MTATPTPELAARLAYARYDYTKIVHSSEPDMDPADLHDLNDLNAEYVAATGEDITLMTADELEAWHNEGVGAAVEAVLGYTGITVGTRVEVKYRTPTWPGEVGTVVEVDMSAQRPYTVAVASGRPGEEDTLLVSADAVRPL